MKVLIIYHSEHHSNTKKLVEAIAGQGDVTLLNVSDNSSLDWSDFDLIGFASGIYYQKFHKDILYSADFGKLWLSRFRYFWPIQISRRYRKGASG